MAKKTYKIKPTIRYRQAFKMEVVREVERSGAPFEHIRRKYGLGVSTVQKWVGQYGHGTRGKVIRVEKPQNLRVLRVLLFKNQRPEPTPGVG